MVNDNIKIAALGGDRRQIYALLRLAGEGKQISVAGLDINTACAANNTGLSLLENAREAIEGADVILLPFPTSADGVRINAPLDRSDALHDVKLSTVISLAKPSARIVGGKLPPTFVASALERGCSVYDLLNIEALEIKNAYITAEAALSIAMNSLSKKIRGARFAITGFGRIAKQLSRLLFSLGAEVTVAARRESDLAFAETLGYSTLKIAGDSWNKEILCGYDMIYNTVPHRLFGRDFLEAVNKKTILVELASVPGGFDIAAAQELGTNISWALSLPGKYAPESAGELIAECVEGIISGEVQSI